METVSVMSNNGDLEAGLQKCAAIKPQITVVFAAPSFFKSESGLKKMAGNPASGSVIGCSTSGEISSKGVSDNSFSAVAMHFDSTEIRVAEAEITTADHSREAGRTLGTKLKGEKLKSIFVLSPGLNVNGSEFVKGIIDIVGQDIVLTGGLAGDGTSFINTFTSLNGQVYNNHAVAFGLYGDKVHVKSGSRGGWKPFGPVRRVTKSVGNILHELDGKPALQLYKEYLGDKAQGLPASGLLYPFSILKDDNHEDAGLIRTLLDVNHELGTITLAGDLPQGSLVRLMHTDTDSLVDGAREAAEEAATSGRKGATFMVSCVGRKIIMGSDVDDEIDAVVEAIGQNSVFAGFYSYGEICPFKGTGFSELHNQTMTITHISEDLVA